MRRLLPPTPSNGRPGGSTSPCSARSCPRVFVGIYYAAQQVATLPAKLKTSFEPVLGPAIVRRLAVDDRAGIAKQVRQVTYWIIAAQLGIALALGIPGRAVMGLVGSGFTGGTAMLGFLLAAEVIAATAVVSEAALIYVARKRNMIISLIMLALEAGLAAALILIMRNEDCRWRTRRPARRSPCAWRSASLDRQVVAAQAQARRAGLRVALGPCLGNGRRRRRRRARSRLFLPPLLQLIIGVPAILVAFVAVLWTKGFGPEDRELFRLRKDEVQRTARRRGRGAARDQVDDDHRLSASAPAGMSV